MGVEFKERVRYLQFHTPKRRYTYASHVRIVSIEFKAQRTNETGFCWQFRNPCRSPGWRPTLGWPLHNMYCCTHRSFVRSRWRRRPDAVSLFLLTRREHSLNGRKEGTDGDIRSKLRAGGWKTGESSYRGRKERIETSREREQPHIREMRNSSRIHYPSLLYVKILRSNNRRNSVRFLFER